MSSTEIVPFQEHQETELVKVQRGRDFLVQATELPPVIDFMNMAARLAHFYKVQKASLEAQNAAAENYLLAQRRAGEMLAEMPKAKGVRGQLSGPDIMSVPDDDVPTLDEIGITPKQSSRFQSIARIPEADFEQAIEQTKEEGKELTSAMMLRLAKTYPKPGEEVSPEPPEPTAESTFLAIERAVFRVLERSPADHYEPVARYLRLLADRIAPPSVHVNGHVSPPARPLTTPDLPRLIYGSVCSGIEGASVAWGPLGFQPAWFAEIEPFCKELLAHHYPEVHNYGDFTGIEAEPGSIDVLVGGTPCQSFSITGLRKGMADDRGNLALEYLRLADRAKPRWLIWENVPGVLSSNGGRDFGSFLGGMEKLGYGWAYRVLDAQFFGVAQRRRRVFVVGYLGDWRPSAAVLSERRTIESGRRPSREIRQVDRPIYGWTADESPKCGWELTPTLRSQQGGIGILVRVNEPCGRDRNLTPLECERLQGFPDHYTRIPFNGKNAESCPDAPRIRALGNSFAVPVVRWIGRRLQFVDSITGVSIHANTEAARV